MADDGSPRSTPPLRLSLYDVGPFDPPSATFNLAAYCLAAATATPEKAALRIVSAEALRDGAADGEVERWSYARIDDAVRRAASGLKARGLQPGDRVVLRLGDTPRFPLLFFATIAAGGVATPTSSQLSADEARLILEDSAARFLCVDAGLEISVDALGSSTPQIIDAAAMEALFIGAERAEFAATAPDDPAFLVYTSGATGRPKGVLHAHRAAWARRMMWRDWYDLRPDDVVMHAGAFNWTYTLGAGLMDPWACGATSIVRAGAKDPAEWPRLAQAAGATLFAAAPAAYRQILKYGDDLADGFAGLRHGLTAGEKLPEPVRAAWESTVGKPLYEAYGMSECSTFISSSPSAPTKPDRLGRPQTGRRVAILPHADDAASTEPLPIGEIGVVAVSRRDPGLMLGYWKRADEEALAFRGDWFLTGDLAEMDADGYLAYRGRGDDLMNALGYRVSPQEVEDALASHPIVAECAAATLQVRADVSVIAAFVVCAEPEAGAAPLDRDALAQDLAAHCETTLAAYKRPREFVFVDALPRTANGKVRRRLLSEQHART